MPAKVAEGFVVEITFTLYSRWTLSKQCYTSGLCKNNHWLFVLNYVGNTFPDWILWYYVTTCSFVGRRCCMFSVPWPLVREMQMYERSNVVIMFVFKNLRYIIWRKILGGLIKQPMQKVKKLMGGIFLFCFTIKL